MFAFTQAVVASRFGMGRFSDPSKRRSHPGGLHEGGMVGRGQGYHWVEKKQEARGLLGMTDQLLGQGMRPR